MGQRSCFLDYLCTIPKKTFTIQSNEEIGTNRPYPLKHQKMLSTKVRAKKWRFCLKVVISQRILVPVIYGDGIKRESGQIPELFPQL
tara:strand:- start:35016 stop:35276 length:261 start_codon:yes stop_codon:yes gene_type:complete